MKVTKLIREYVEEQVSKIYHARENPYTKQAELDKQKFEDFKKKLLENQKKEIEKFFNENNVLDGWNDYKPCKPSAQIPGFSRCVTAAMKSEEDWKQENIRQKNAKVREIILALELGANRQELNDMIAKLLEE